AFRFCFYRAALPEWWASKYCWAGRIVRAPDSNQSSDGGNRVVRFGGLPAAKDRPDDVIPYNLEIRRCPGTRTGRQRLFLGDGTCRVVVAEAGQCDVLLARQLYLRELSRTAGGHEHLVWKPNRARDHRDHSAGFDSLSTWRQLASDIRLAQAGCVSSFLAAHEHHHQLSAVGDSAET